MILCDIVQFYSPLSGGVKRYVLDKAEFLSHVPGLRHITLIPSDRDHVTESEHTAVYEVKSPFLPGSKSYRALVSERKIAEVVAWERPDLIEMGDPYRAAWIGLRQARRFGIPVVGYYHSDYPRALGRTISKFSGKIGEALFSKVVNKYLVRLYNQMDATVVATERYHDLLSNMGIKRLYTIPLGVDVHDFRPVIARDRIRNELCLNPGTKLILYVGRLAREKNISELLQMQSILEKKLDIHLHIVGDGEQHRLVRNAIKKGSAISWLPYIEDKECLVNYYSASDLFIHPGANETFGLVSLEAQACGLRVVAVKGGGVESTLEHEANAMLASSHKPQDLAQAVESALKISESVGSRLVRRRHIVTKFSTDTTYARMLKLYRDLVFSKKYSEPIPKKSEGREYENRYSTIPT